MCFQLSFPSYLFQTTFLSRIWLQEGKTHHPLTGITWNASPKISSGPSMQPSDRSMFLLLLYFLRLLLNHFSPFPFSWKLQQFFTHPLLSWWSFYQFPWQNWINRRSSKDSQDLFYQSSRIYFCTCCLPHVTMNKLSITLSKANPFMSA